MAEGRFTNPVVTSLAGIRDFFSKQQLAGRFTDEDRADGLTVLITGVEMRFLDLSDIGSHQGASAIELSRRIKGDRVKVSINLICSA